MTELAHQQALRLVMPFAVTDVACSNEPFH
jgi:hypothetical protein